MADISGVSDVVNFEAISVDENTKREEAFIFDDVLSKISDGFSEYKTAYNNEEQKILEEKITSGIKIIDNISNPQIYNQIGALALEEFNEFSEDAKKYANDTTGNPGKFFLDAVNASVEAPIKLNKLASDMIVDNIADAYKTGSEWISGLGDAYENNETISYLAESAAITKYKLGEFAAELALGAAFPVIGGMKKTYNFADTDRLKTLENTMQKYEMDRLNASLDDSTQFLTQNRMPYLGVAETKVDFKDAMFDMQKSPGYFVFGDKLADEMSTRELLETLTRLGDKKFGNNQLFNVNQFQFNKIDQKGYYSKPTGTYSPLIVSTTGKLDGDLNNPLKAIGMKNDAYLKSVFANIPDSKNDMFGPPSHSYDYGFDFNSKNSLSQKETFTGLMNDNTDIIISKHLPDGSSSVISSYSDIFFSDFFSDN